VFASNVLTDKRADTVRPYIMWKDFLFLRGIADSHHPGSSWPGYQGINGDAFVIGFDPGGCVHSPAKSAGHVYPLPDISRI